jgi:hypothetical protein
MSLDEYEAIRRVPTHFLVAVRRADGRLAHGDLPAPLGRTTVRWDVEPSDAGATVNFRHAGFTDEEEAGRVAYTWGQVMVRLKAYAESGKPDPVFS